MIQQPVTGTTYTSGPVFLVSTTPNATTMTMTTLGTTYIIQSSPPPPSMQVLVADVCVLSRLYFSYPYMVL